ncbi:hypothetical protein EDC01DRAFT_644303 [Geopyxis carbonaria]|nr:hypothetical protein EDC01DRAFT_644303 [Geopyxis carbonaria]
MAALCELCNAQDAKYKCPTCRIAYCSLACYKPHKLTHIDDAPAAADSTADAPTDDPAAAYFLDTAGAPPPAPHSALPTSSQPNLAPLLSDPTLHKLLENATLKKDLLRVHEATQDRARGMTADKADAKAARMVGAMRKDGEVQEWAEYVLGVLERGAEEAGGAEGA